MLFGHRYNFRCHLLSSSNVTSEGDSVEVTTTALEHFFRYVHPEGKIDLIRMDVRGAEWHVMEGAHELLRDINPRIIMEFFPRALRSSGTDPAELMGRLQGCGFGIRLIEGPSASAGDVSADWTMGDRQFPADVERSVSLNLFLERAH
jgi:hypothetical protein